LLDDITIIRDKVTKVHKGCAFVEYAEPSADVAMETAVERLHGKMTISGSSTPLQVKPADTRPHSERESKLFVGMLPKTLEEGQVRGVFEVYGDITEVHIIRDQRGSSRGCAFIKYQERESALRAIDGVHQKMCLLPGRALTVKFADRHRHASGNPEGFPMQGRAEARAHFLMQPAQATLPYQIPPQVQYLGHPHSPPPGYVVAPSYGQQIVYGFEAAPYQYFPGQGGTVSHQRQSIPVMNTSSTPPDSSAMSPTRAEAPSVRAVTGGDTSETSEERPSEGPPGANLFIYHLPHDLTDADLATLFSANGFGNVISAKVYVDKRTGESKGFGFVSYDSPAAAETAISQMNGFQIGSKRLKVQHKRVQSAIYPATSFTEPSLAGHQPSNPNQHTPGSYEVPFNESMVSELSLY